MYAGTADIERDVLRQGDIVTGIHLVGALNLQAIKYTVDFSETKVGWSVSSAPLFSDAMVLSHSCEIDLANNIKVTSIILAPLRDISKATNAGAVDELKASNIIHDTDTATYLKYFYVEPHDALDHKNGAVVDFSKCFSIRKNSYDLLLSRKVLQLTTEAGDAMAFKLALYFFRAGAPQAPATPVPPLAVA